MNDDDDMSLKAGCLFVVFAMVVCIILILS